MVIQTWKMAWSAVCANKLRTFLTMLGIIIGVTALIVLVSIAGGASSTVSEKISQMGTNYLSVRINDDKENPLRIKEFSKLLSDKTIEAAAPFGSASVTGKSGYTSGTMTVHGTTGDYFSIMGLELSSGRFLKKTDSDNHSYVIVITADTAVELFGREDVQGETLSLDGRHFQVVGVLDEDTDSQASAMVASSDSQEDGEQTVALEGYIPYSTLTRIADNVLDITQFYVSSTDDESIDQTEAAVNRILSERLEGDEDAFTVQSQSEIMETMGEVNSTMSLMLGGIAVISLLVGGIGIMNIMLVSVTERTREIGIRKAIGAGKGMILLQFMMEAVIVSMAGCMVGIGVSWVSLEIAGKIMGDAMSVSMDGQVVLAAVVFSALIGVVFGIYPASKAASKRPIEALRFS